MCERVDILVIQRSSQRTRFRTRFLVSILFSSSLSLPRNIYIHILLYVQTFVCIGECCFYMTDIVHWRRFPLLVRSYLALVTSPPSSNRRIHSGAEKPRQIERLNKISTNARSLARISRWIFSRWFVRRNICKRKPREFASKNQRQLIFLEIELFVVCLYARRDFNVFLHVLG